MNWMDAYFAARRDIAIGWIPRDEIAMDGEDAVAVLHKLCSNNIEALEAGQGCEAFVCNVQGKIVGHVVAYRTPTGLRLSTSVDQASHLIAHLDRYVIREDVRFQSLDEASLYVLGPQSDSRLDTLGAPIPAESLTCEVWEGEDEQRLLVRRLRDLVGFQIVGPRDLLESAVANKLEDQGASMLSDEAWNALRIESFLPEYPQDVSEENLPQEVARDEVAISFTKGCYLGQETVARIDAMGHVNWMLRGLRFPTDSQPIPGEKLLFDGKETARITSVCHSPQLDAPLAMAYVRRQHAAAGAELATESSTATVVELPLAAPGN